MDDVESPTAKLLAEVEFLAAEMRTEGWLDSEADEFEAQVEREVLDAEHPGWDAN